MKKELPTVKIGKNQDSILGYYRVEGGIAKYTNLKDWTFWDTDQEDGFYNELGLKNKGMETKVYPKLEVTDFVKAFDLDKALIKKIADVCVFVSDDKIRPYMCGFLVSSKDQKIVGTDSRRMALFELKIDTDFPNVIVAPRPQFSTNLKKAKSFYVSENGQYVKLVGDGWFSVHSTVEGSFPNYSRVIPEAKSKFFSLPGVDEMKKIVKTVKFYNPKSKRVYLSENGIIWTEGNGKDPGIHIGTMRNSPDENFAFNAEFLLPLAGLDVFYHGNRTAVTATTPEGVFYVVMPMQMD